MKKIILVVGLLLYASSVFSSSVPKTLRSFMAVPDNPTEEELFTFVANEFRTNKHLVIWINPFQVGVRDMGWFSEVLQEACANGNTNAQEIKAAYDQIPRGETESYWEKCRWVYDEEVLMAGGTSPSDSSGEKEFFTILKWRMLDPRANGTLRIIKPYMIDSITKTIAKDIKDKGLTGRPDPQLFKNYVAWLKNCKDTAFIDLKAPENIDYYINLCEQRAQEITKWKSESELIRIGLSTGILSDECLRGLKEKDSPFLFDVTTDFRSNQFPLLRDQFKKATTLAEINRALKFLKDLDDSEIRYLGGEFQLKLDLEAKKAALEKSPDNPNNLDKNKKNEPSLNRQSTFQMVGIGLVIALVSYLVYRYHLQNTANKYEEAEAEA